MPWKKACEPLNIQINLSSYEVVVVHTTTADVAGLSHPAYSPLTARLEPT